MRWPFKWLRTQKADQATKNTKVEDKALPRRRDWARVRPLTPATGTTPPLIGAKNLDVAGATPRTRHVTTNLMIELDDELRAASARCYFTVFQAIPGVIELQPIVRGAYRDSFECVDGSWRFRERVMITDGVGVIAHHLNEDPF